MAFVADYVMHIHAYYIFAHIPTALYDSPLKVSPCFLALGVELPISLLELPNPHCRPPQHTKS